MKLLIYNLEQVCKSTWILFQAPPWPCSKLFCTLWYQSVNQPINQSINQSVNQSINQSVNQLINQSISQSTNHSINQSINQSIYQSTNPNFYVFFFASTYGRVASRPVVWKFYMILDWRESLYKIAGFRDRYPVNTQDDVSELLAIHHMIWQ